MKKTQIAIASLLALASVSAFADEANPNTIAVGYTHIAVHSDSAPFSSNGPAFLTPYPSGVAVGNANTVYIEYTRRITDHLDINLALGVPPEHDNYGTGNLAPFGVTAKVKQRAPTIFAVYNFFDEKTAFRPFVGVGINYTQFYDAHSTPNGDLAGGGPTKIELGDSVGWAAKVGGTFKFADRWSLTGAVATADVKSGLRATTGSIVRSTVIDFRPIAYTLTVGYSF